MDADDEALAYSGSDSDVELVERRERGRERHRLEEQELQHEPNQEAKQEAEVSVDQDSDEYKRGLIPPLRCTLYVSEFVPGISGRRLATVFEPFGKIAEISVMPPRLRDGFQYAFVSFRSEKSVEALLKSVKDGKVIDGGLALHPETGKGIHCERAKDLPKSARGDAYSSGRRHRREMGRKVPVRERPQGRGRGRERRSRSRSRSESRTRSPTRSLSPLPPPPLPPPPPPPVQRVLDAADVDVDV